MPCPAGPALFRVALDMTALMILESWMLSQRWLKITHRVWADGGRRRHLFAGHSVAVLGMKNSRLLQDGTGSSNRLAMEPGPRFHESAY